jgi:ornithine cyclodeaminase/alanine dehydrogenase-like protein (mu-crystallin family)
MRVFSAEDIDAALDFPSLIDALSEAMRGGFIAPRRHHHEIERAGEPAATQLLMPAWTESASRLGLYIGTKVVNVFPGNSARGLPAVLGLYVLQSGRTGEALAVLDGTRLTHWRTAAASALAAHHLARSDVKRLLIVGAGALAPFLARAHASERSYEAITVWNHRPEGARRTAETLAKLGLPACAREDLKGAVAEADVISSATLASEPLIAGAWLKPGQHLDLVGAFNMRMREADDEALRRSRIFVDTEDACVEGGDVALGLASGAITRAHVVTDLPALCRGAKGRRSDDEITLFKSVGAAIEDLAAAMLVWRRTGDVEPTKHSKRGASGA